MYYPCIIEWKLLMTTTLRRDVDMLTCDFNTPLRNVVKWDFADVPSNHLASYFIMKISHLLPDLFPLWTFKNNLSICLSCLSARETDHLIAFLLLFSWIGCLSRAYASFFKSFIPEPSLSLISVILPQCRLLVFLSTVFAQPFYDQLWVSRVSRCFTD